MCQHFIPPTCCVSLSMALHKKVKSLCQFWSLSLRSSAYLCDLCVKIRFQRRGRRDTQRTAEKNHHLPTFCAKPLSISKTYVKA
jgi:hypothetical protein